MDHWIQDFFSFIWKFICFWWTMLPGVILEALSLVNHSWYKKFSERFVYTPEQRKKFAHTVLLSGFVIANFFAFHDAKEETRGLQQSVNSYHTTSLNIFLRTQTFSILNQGRAETWVVVQIINDSDSPIMISQCKWFFGPQLPLGSIDYGIYNLLDEDYYKESNIVLPKLIQPAEIYEFPLMALNYFKNINRVVLIDNHNIEHDFPKDQITQMLTQAKNAP